MTQTAKYIFITLIIGLLTSLTAVSRDLRVTTVGDRECYIYDVKKGESIYDVSRELGIPPVEITRYNPTAADGLRAGMRLYIPCAIIDKGRPRALESNTGPVVATQPVISVPAARDGEESGLTENTTYKVIRGESLYGISHKHGMTTDQLIALNPSAEYGVKEGDILVVKAGGHAARQTGHATVTYDPTPDTSHDTPTTEYEDPDKYSLIPSEERISQKYIVPTDEPVVSGPAPDTVNMAVMLPFMLHEDEPGKNSQLFTEFYKGLLLAADSLRNYPGHHVSIYTFDTSASADSVSAIMRRPEMAGMDLIIGPDNEEHLQIIADGMMSGTRLYNTFNVRSNLHADNPRVIQANIPHAPMLAKAVDAFADMYGGYTPVFLSRIDGAADKDAFTSMLRQRLEADSVTYREITFRNLLSHRDLDTLDMERDYVFVPVSGSRAEFAKLSEAINRMGQSRPDRSIRIFGYPDWITFRGEYLNRLCELEATIYTRFYADMKNPETETFAHKFQTAYGAEMLDAAPVQGILGFDTGMFLLSLFKEYGHGYADHIHPYTGLQSVINFNHDNSHGDVNDALLIVTFGPDGSIKTTLE